MQINSFEQAAATASKPVKKTKTAVLQVMLKNV
jgi:hypothetical protein